MQPRLFLGPLGVEARTQLTVQLPSKLLLDVLSRGNSNQSEVVPNEGGDSFGLNLEVQRLDLVLSLP